MITLDVEYLTYDRLVKKLYFTLISGLWFILALFFSTSSVNFAWVGSHINRSFMRQTNKFRGEGLGGIGFSLAAPRVDFIFKCCIAFVLCLLNSFLLRKKAL